MDSSLRAIGVTKYSMIAVLSSAMLNIVLDPIFIYGYFGAPALGVVGAALATNGNPNIRVDKYLLPRLIISGCSPAMIATIYGKKVYTINAVARATSEPYTIVSPRAFLA